MTNDMPKEIFVIGSKILGQWIAIQHLYGSGNPTGTSYTLTDEVNKLIAAAFKDGWDNGFGSGLEEAEAHGVYGEGKDNGCYTEDDMGA